MNQRTLHRAASPLFSALLVVATAITTAAFSRAPDESPAVRTSLEDLAGTAWVLVAWSDEEPLTEGPEVTLKWQEGGFTGNAGCNDYFAGIEETEQPGAIVVGGVGRTKKMCLDAMAVENRFVALLGRVSEFAVVRGSLRLTYATDDGGTAAMIFAETPASW